MKYRIVSRGRVFIVQEKRSFFWEDFLTFRQRTGEFILDKFSKLEDAENHIKYIKRYRMEQSIPDKVIKYYD